MLDGEQPIQQGGGRCTIDDVRRTTTHSKRALAGKLSVIQKRCSFCNHHKAFVNTSGKPKCTRCKKYGARRSRI